MKYSWLFLGVTCFFMITSTSKIQASTNVMKGYPKIVDFFSYESPNQALVMSNDSLIVSGDNNQKKGKLLIRTLKKYNPNAKLLFSVNSYEIIPKFFSSQHASYSLYSHIYPGWYLTLAGTTLSKSISATQTLIPVKNAAVIKKNFPEYPDLLIGRESMHILSINLKNNTIKVERGYYSNASPHSVGTRIAQHYGSYSGNGPGNNDFTWMMNMSIYCPIDPKNHMTWDQYVVHQVVQHAKSVPWNGVYFDEMIPNIQDFNKSIDANNNNVADGGLGPSRNGWMVGVSSIIEQTRKNLPNFIILDNGPLYPGSSGREYEHVHLSGNRWDALFNQYYSQSTHSIDVLNPDTNNTGIQNLQKMRFALATSMMGNGYFTYDYGSFDHGATWWYDEYDNGAGASLRAPVNKNNAKLYINTQNGTRFHAGEVIFVPDTGYEQANDEQMLILRATKTMIIVKRGYNHTVRSQHAIYSKVMTKNELKSNLGWLGQPLGPPESIRQMNNSSKISIHHWTFGIIDKEKGTKKNINKTIQIHVFKKNIMNAWFVSLSHSGLFFKKNQSYTFSFDVKANSSRYLQTMIMQTKSPWTEYVNQYLHISTSWHHYSIVFSFTKNINSAKITFPLAKYTGTTLFKNFYIQKGNPDVLERKFQHGLVILNATSKSQHIYIGSGYRHINGTQDHSLNNGKSVTNIELTPDNAVFLVKK